MEGCWDCLGPLLTLPATQDIRRTLSRFTFQAMVTRVHSPLAACRPGMDMRGLPIASLMTPNSGSTVCLRNP